MKLVSSAVSQLAPEIGPSLEQKPKLLLREPYVMIAAVIPNALRDTRIANKLREPAPAQ